MINLLKSYFNLQISQKILQTKINKKTKIIRLRFRRLSTNKVFIGRGELKHTSKKVLITFFVLNTQGMFLLQNYNKAKQEILFPKNNLKKFINYDRDGKPKITYNRPFSLYDFSILGDHDKLYEIYMMSIINKFANSKELELLNTYYLGLTNLVETKILSEDEKYLMFSKKVAN
jgi:hypothetical protein